MKTIANRIKHILPPTVDEIHCAFVPNRMITNNTTIAFECVHFMKKKVKGKKGHMALKLVMSKAYDRVERSFLEKVFSIIGFPQRWICMIMRCVSIVTFSVLINGEPYRDFHLHRGLRQGDLLSPYLFILCAKSLLAMIKTGSPLMFLSF